MVIDDGMHETAAQQRVVAGAAWRAGVSDRGCPAALALGAAGAASAATVGETAELGDVDVDQRAGWSCSSHRIGSPETRSTQKGRLSRHRSGTAWTVDKGTPSRPAI